MLLCSENFSKAEFKGDAQNFFLAEISRQLAFRLCHEIMHFILINCHVLFKFTKKWTLRLFPGSGVWLVRLVLWLSHREKENGQQLSA